MVKVAVDAIGCKLNQAETERLARELAAAGYELVPASAKADICILNTCSVTHIAERKSRAWLRQAHRANPEALLVATGCYAECSAAELGRIEGVGLVVGNGQKPAILGLVEEAGIRASGGNRTEQAHSGRTRSFIKIQDGCSNFCAYCIVPLVRGPENNVSADLVVNDINGRIAAGYREVVLTGTEPGAYSWQGLDLSGLIERVLAETGITRLRLSSLQPQEITPGLLRLWGDSRLCRHFHLSLQSGCDGVLRRMGRRYSAADYERAVALIRASLPGAAVTTDIIVGFPGETETEFQESLGFARRMGFARMHVFPFSPRPGTRAAIMPSPVPDKVKHERSRAMRALAAASARAFRQGFIGKVMPVLWEQQANGVWSGLTDNYIRVYTRSTADLTNRLEPVRLYRLGRDGIWGIIQ